MTDRTFTDEELDALALRLAREWERLRPESNWREMTEDAAAALAFLRRERDAERAYCAGRAQDIVTLGQMAGRTMAAEDRAAAAEAEAERLRAGLEFYANPDNWRRDSPLDADSGNFTGGPARALLEKRT